VIRHLIQRVCAYLGQENKRKNLVGEGFEDVLAFLISRLPGAARTVLTRPLLHEIPGFREHARNEKPKIVDVAVILSDTTRVIITAKWSIRADREEQFSADFDAYARLESAGKDFDYVLVTNEFDAARLVAACERRRANASLFSSVVHINPGGVLAAYGEEPKRSAGKLVEYIRSGRLKSIEAWLSELIA